MAKPAGERWIVLGHTQTRHPSTAHTRPLTYQLAMSLFKKAQSAVAHNSKIPSLGNSDLKQLQEIGILTAQTRGKNTYFINEPLVQLISEGE